MAYLNLCQFIGRIGSEPEIRTFEGGNKIATARMAVTKKYTDRNQQPQERTEWIGLVFNGRNADLAESYVHKGDMLYVQGEWHNREWTDQSGNKRTNTELQVSVMQMLERKKQDAPSAPVQAPQPQRPAPPQYTPAPPAPPAPARPQYQAAPASNGFEQDSTSDLPF